MEDEVVIDMRSQSAASNPRQNEGDAAQGSESGSNHGSTFSGGYVVIHMSILRVDHG